MTPLGWALWFLAVTALVFATFARFEARGPTLSEAVWRTQRSFPAFAFIVGLTVGLFVGFLGAHFFWPNQGLDCSALFSPGG